MMKRSYDFVFSLGASCACSATLRRAGLQFASFPFDWNKGNTLLERVQMMNEDFAAWADPAHLQAHEDHTDHERDCYRDDRSHVILSHDFPKGVPLAKGYIEVSAKYTRRIERLKTRLAAAERALAVWVDDQGEAPVSEAMIAEAKQVLSAKCSGKMIDLLVIRCRKGRLLENCELQVLASGALLADYDYSAGEEKDGIERYNLNTRKLADWLRARFAAVDYRSPAEKKAWRDQERAKRYGRYHASSFWEMLINKFGYKLFCHLRKHLVKKGFYLGEW